MKDILLNFDLALIAVNFLLSVYLLATKRLITNLQPIAWALIISATDEAIAYVFSRTVKNNLIVYYLSSPLEYAAFAWFFSTNIDYPLVKKIIKVSAALCLCTIVGYLYFYLQLNSLAKAVTHEYAVVATGALLNAWSIIYIINNFDRVNKYKKLNFSFLSIVAAILFYNCFGVLLNLSEIYLINYSVKHQIAITEMFSPKYKNMYASQQYQSLNELQYIMVFLWYLIMFTALIKSSNFSKKQHSV